MIRREIRRALWLAVAGIAAAGAVWGYLLAQGGGSTPQYRTARVERGPLAAVVSASGALNAVTTVQVGSQISGQIQELLADFNTVVRKGQVIARLDAATFEARVSQARAELESAQASVMSQQAQVERARADVENARAALAEAKAQTGRAQVAVLDAKRDLDRKLELFRRELVSRSERDTAQATYDAAVTQHEAARAKEQALAAAIRSAEAQRRVTDAVLDAAHAQVKQKQAALQQAVVDLQHTTIRAPVDGIVVARSVDVGQTVAASLQAPTLFTIARDLTRMQVEASVPEADIGRIRLDGRVTFTVDAFPSDSFSGRVVQIRKAPQVVQNVVTYTVVVEVENLGGKLLPGMTANVRAVVAEKANVLKVPNAALRFRPTDVEAGAAPPPAPAAGTGSDEPASESMRERLVRQLGLSDTQQAQLDQILREGRDERKALRDPGLPEPERKARSQRIREATRARIRDILTPDQRTRYDAATAARKDDGAGLPGRVWVVGPDGKPKPVALSLGISDGRMTEVRAGDLGEGQEVIVGTAGRPTAPGNQTPGGRAPRLRL